VLQQNANPALIALPVSITALSVGAAIYTHVSQKRGRQRTVTERETKYRAMLQTRGRDLLAQRDRQLAALNQIDPAPEELLPLVERRDRRMWQRSPRDPDFLVLRAGIGMQPFAVTVKPPRDDRALDVDPLMEEAQALARDLAEVPGAPVGLPLRQAGVAGIVGERASAVGMARALAMQIAAHHSPEEVKICALFPASETEEWSWLRWLPHTWSDDGKHRLLASDRDSASRILMGLYEMLSRRRSQAQTAPHGTRSEPSLPHIVFFLADALLVENRPITQLLLHESQTVGAYPIFLAARLEDLPRASQAIIETSHDTAVGRLIITAPIPSHKPIDPDEVALELADRFARAMAPIRLRRVAGKTELPSAVPILELFDASSVDDLDVFTRWNSHLSQARDSLAAPVGRRAGGESLMLDLHERAHGPHGLVAGATGSGKSELLQAMVASLAVDFHPHDVAFVLIDFKGGSMSNAFEGLPHLAGAITNLEGTEQSALAARALAAIRGELQRRQTLLARAGENHVDRYQQRYWEGGVTEPLPHLIIVVDEFAELATELPDFMKQLISAVRVGRSLGIHLILATQKPAGVVNEQIWSNARFRICLRVERPEDSREVLKRPDAAGLTQPGRAYFQVGNDEVFELFQSAWGGAAYGADDSRETTDTGKTAEGIFEVALDGTRRALRVTSRPAAIHDASTQLQALVTHLGRVAEDAGIEKVRGPWLPPLPTNISLDQVLTLPNTTHPGGWDGTGWQPANSWMEPIVGLVDDPANQYQGPLPIELGREGHLAVYGAPGSGKTSFLQSLVLSLALTHSPQDLNIYLLDFGGRTLALFDSLPHVGGVVLPNDAERVNRLISYLLREVETRQELFSEAGVNTLPAYRQTVNERAGATSRTPQMPAIVAVIDNYPGLVGTYPDLEDRLAQIARDGGNLGIHLVLGADSPNLIRTKVGNSITLAVALQLADKSDYANAMQRIVGLQLPTIPGRGLIKGNPPLEFQTALPVQADTEAGRTASLRALIGQMNDAWQGPRARPVPMLPERVALSDLLAPQSADDAAQLLSTPRFAGHSAVPLALDVQTLDVVAVDLADGPHFLVTGPPHGGKTTLLQTWTLALADYYPPGTLHLFLSDFRRDGLMSLRTLPQVATFADDEGQLTDVLSDITEALQERRQALEEARRLEGSAHDEREFARRYPAIVLVIDDYDITSDGLLVGAKSRLEQLVKRERGLGFHLILAISSTRSGGGIDGTVRALRDTQTGFLLGSSEQDDAQALGLRLPFGEGGRLFPPGQGYYARRGRTRRVKVATPNAGPIKLPDLVARITGRYARVG
jgi:S-DNA-T family DNA segregation ATPase FtsK/SpoIIIE